MAYPLRKQESYSNIGGINQKASTYVTGDKEVLDLLNLDFQTPGAWTQRPGFACQTLGSTISVGADPIVRDLFYNVGRDGSFITFVACRSDVFTFQANTSALVNLFTWSAFSDVINHANFQEQVFITNAVQYLKWSTGATVTPGIYSLPAPPNTTAINSANAAAGFPAGTYQFYVGFKDDLGFYGPTNNIFTTSCPTFTAFFRIQGMTLTAGSASYKPTQYVVYTKGYTGQPVGSFFAYENFYGTTLTEITLIYSQLTISPSPVELPQLTTFTLVPKYLETFQNRLFMAGFDGITLQNTVAFSEPLEPEEVLKNNNFVVISDQYNVTGLKRYLQSLLIGCFKGIFRLTGDNPENFNVQQLTSQYGFLSNKGTVVFNNRLWFIDEKGLIEYDGANFNPVSNRVDNFFLNATLAGNKLSQAIHVLDRNEVWFLIDTDNGRYPTTILVYDYLADGFTVFKISGNSPLALGLFEINTGIGGPIKAVYGDLSAMVYATNTNFNGDQLFGIPTLTPFTCAISTRFHSPFGNSVQSMFRRMWLDQGAYFGSTLPVNVNLYADHITQTVSYTTTIFGSTFQNYIDFGVSAKALAMQFQFTTGLTQTRQIFGYTIASRYLRDV